MSFHCPSPLLLPSAVSTLLNIRLCESSSGKMVSVLDLPGSILIVPQATLGGKAKSRGMQYHNNIGKEDGLRLYSTFVSLCEEIAAVNGDKVMVKHGTYGNRQVLKLDTNGPYTHLMDFWAAPSREEKRQVLFCDLMLASVWLKGGRAVGVPCWRWSSVQNKHFLTTDFTVSNYH